MLASEEFRVERTFTRQERIAPECDGLRQVLGATAAAGYDRNTTKV
jgi:hypothetical protein